MSKTTVKIKDEVLTFLHRIPSPPEESIPAGASAALLRETEEVHGILFPPKLREWLLTSNGPCVGPGGLVGIGNGRDSLDLSSIFESYPAWKERGWIPVAGDGCGSYYVVDTRNNFGTGEPVLFVDVNETSEDAAFIAASDVWNFLRFLLAKEVYESRWPFDKSEVTNADPEILRFANVSLPWDT